MRTVWLIVWWLFAPGAYAQGTVGWAGSRLRFRVIPWAIYFLTGVCSLYGQGTIRFIHLTFDGLPIIAPGTSRLVHEYSEGGLRFTGADTYWNSFVRQGGGYQLYPENGTAYIQAGFTSSLSFGFIDGSTFSLEAVDLAEYSTVFPEPFTAYFIGYRHDGSIVTNALTTDGIIDGTGPLPDFQTFQFSAEMRNLDRVEIPLWSYGWSLDNLIVSTPEPTSGLLLALGATIVWALRRTRRCPRAGPARRSGGS